jgi:hypothetical protein
MLPQHYLQVPLPIHIAARFLLVWPPWEWLTQGCSQTCDLVGLHPLVRLHIMVDDEVSSFFLPSSRNKFLTKMIIWYAVGSPILWGFDVSFKRKKKSF